MTGPEFIPDEIKIAAMRRLKVSRCLKWRAFIARKKEPAIAVDRQWYLDRLKEEQIGLLKLRIWRATGRYPSQN
jgi:hypothetical protein